MSTWEPGRYFEQLELEGPYSGVPDHLFGPLVGWVTEKVGRPVPLFTVATTLRLPIKGDPLRNTGHFGVLLNTFEGWLRADPGFLLDAIEVALAKLDLHYPDTIELEVALRLGNSAYQLRDDHKALERRIEAGVKEQVQTAAALDPKKAGFFLTSAWNHAYGLKTDPSKSYGDSIKAVECAVIPVVEPNNSKATLGTSLGELRKTTDKWMFSIGSGVEGIDAIIKVTSLLWGGQTSRHGSGRAPVPETQEAAEAAVHLAATLVQWFASGAIQKRNPPST